ncbi:DNA-3-methyladenine glycosylase [Nocardioides sp. zg-DK7169]|uniref:DNA-3-methyladenine glycosylase n=1 Tax=Nocardioides sp. zg-DK7169 TaxID=2736600 RepID=UPI001551B022|nr:DNA-3-methyladenine glycosylase [Nocardioides sp. zg-DK7169]NPC99091.1 DNA-3-methyladenine glycosylase [Nocardioides sp. zg-DK7169]
MTTSRDLLAVLRGPAEQVAPLLLGAELRNGPVAIRLTEVEAYAGAADPGSHAFRGRTARNATMFGPAGRLYCYFTYGMHVCCNVVTGPEGEASAVLLRAGEVVDGLELVRERRPGSTDRDLVRGPARLCRALDISLDDDGTDLVAGPIRLTLPEPPDSERLAPEVCSGPRVGLRGAPERPWRFWLAGERSVSAYRPAKPR